MDDHVKKTVSVYDALADRYAAEINKYPPHEERNIFISLLPKNGKILDRGCAAGRDSKYFFDSGFRVTGVDLSKNLLKIAKRNVLGVEFISGDIRKMTFSKDSFDGIWAHTVLHHLKRTELTPLLINLHKILRKDGIIYIEVNEGKGEGYKADKFSHNIKRFFTYIETDELTDMLKESGFNIIRIYRWNIKKRWKNERNINRLSCFAGKT